MTLGGQTSSANKSIFCPYDCGWNVRGGHLGLSNHIRSCPLRTVQPGSSSRKRRSKRSSCASKPPKPTSHANPVDDEIEIEDEDYGWNSTKANDTKREEDRYARDGIVSKTPGDNERNNVKLFAVKLNRLVRKAGRREVADVYRMIVSGEVSIEQLRNEMPTIEDVKQTVHSLVEDRLNADGFEKRVVGDETGVVAVVYVRKLKTVLEKQINLIDRKDIFVNAKEARRGIGEAEVDAEIHSHPMSAGIGKYCVNVVREHVESAGCGPSSFWKCEKHGRPSFAGIIQIYTDKSVTSMKASGFVFYPLHALLMNYNLSSRQRMITGGHTIVGYLPCEYSTDGSNGESTIAFGVNRDEKLRILHNAVEMMTVDVKTQLMDGFPVQTSDGKEMTLHPCIGSYVADLPEAKDLLGVLNGNRGLRNCHRCLCYSSDMNKYNHSSKRRRLKEMAHALKLFRELVQRATDSDVMTAEECKRMKERATEILRKYSLNGVDPIFGEYPLTNEGCFDPYGIFHFEPLHNVHIGTTKFLLQLIIELIEDRKTRPRHTFNLLNSFLREIDRVYPCPGMSVDHSASGKDPNMNGLFMKGGLKGFLEAKDFRAIENVLPFLGMIVDEETGQDGDNSVTTVMTQYCDLIRTMYRVDRKDYWSFEEVASFDEDIAKFKALAVKVFGQYHGNQLCTEKFHMLDHLIEDLKQVGSIHFISGGLFESSHTNFKRHYRTTSMRKREVMDTCMMRKVEEEVHQDMTENRVQRPKRIRRTKAVMSAVAEDCAVLQIGRNQRTEVSFLELRRIHERSNVDNVQMFDKIAERVYEDIRADMSEDSIEMFLNDVESLVKENGGSTKNLLMSRSYCCTVPSIGTPVADDIIDVDGVPHVHVKNTQRRTLFNAISARNYRNRNGLHQDVVMLENNGCECCPVHSRCIWFGKLMLLTRLRYVNGNDERVVDDYAFVRYFEVVKNETDVDRALGCVKLRWERSDDEPLVKGERPGHWYSITPLSSVVGLVGIVPCQVLLHGKTERLKNGKYERRRENEVEWFDRLYFVNRFYYKEKSSAHAQDIVECLPHESFEEVS